jgi:hypothetical protein
MFRHFQISPDLGEMCLECRIGSQCNGIPANSGKIDQVRCANDGRTRAQHKHAIRHRDGFADVVCDKDRAFSTFRNDAGYIANFVAKVS